MLKKKVIMLATPPLNISNNPNNMVLEFLKNARKFCSNIAYKKSEVSNMATSKKEKSSSPIHHYGSSSNPSNVYKLHEAIEIVLRNQIENKATYRVIAEEIAKQELYRKNDGTFPKPSQINLRAKNYPQFDISERGIVKLKRRD